MKLMQYSYAFLADSRGIKRQLNWRAYYYFWLSNQSAPFIAANELKNTHSNLIKEDRAKSGTFALCSIFFYLPPIL
jgi:hypothetical protein